MHKGVCVVPVFFVHLCYVRTSKLQCSQTNCIWKWLLIYHTFTNSIQEVNPTLTVTGALTCVSPYRDVIWTPPLMSSPSSSFPSILLPSFFFWYVSPSAPHCLSCTNTHFPCTINFSSVILLQAPCKSEVNNLNAKTSETTQGSKIYFPSRCTIIKRLVSKEQRSFLLQFDLSQGQCLSQFLYPLVGDNIP